MTELQQLRRDCAHKRWEYQIARRVYAEVSRLSVPDTTAVQRELKEALVAYYRAHGALHSAMRSTGAAPVH
jgi:hypothetical protein